MAGLSPELLRDLRTILSECGTFGSDSSVFNLFKDARISPWRDRVPSAGNPGARISALINYLYQQSNTSNQNALALFLCVLSEEYNPEVACRQQLRDLVKAVEKETESASTCREEIIEDNDESAKESNGGERQKRPPVATSETYVDFDLHITPEGHAIARSPEGESPAATIDVAVPPSIQTMLDRIKQNQSSEEMLVQFGRQLYAWLFPGPIHTHLQQTEAAARANRAKLRLRLRVEADTLAALPLEFAYRDLGNYFFATNPDTVLSRYLNLSMPPGYVRRREGPLHMLLLIAAPKDRGILVPEEWETILRDALAGPVKRGEMTLDVVPHATRRAVRDALLRQKPDIVQFVGHGDYRRGRGYLMLENRDGTTWELDERRFASLFAGNDDHLGLISLATCKSATSAAPQSFVGIAPKLVEQDTPAVVAMQYTVRVRAAQIFLEDFYTYLAARKPVDWAVQQGRNAVALELGLDNREFATPVLYMRAENGEIF